MLIRICYLKCTVWDNLREKHLHLLLMCLYCMGTYRGNADFQSVLVYRFCINNGIEERHERDSLGWNNASKMPWLPYFPAMSKAILCKLCFVMLSQNGPTSFDGASFLVVLSGSQCNCSHTEILPVCSLFI